MGCEIGDLRKIVNFCRRNGILYYKVDGFEFRISKSAIRYPKEKSNKKPKLPEGPMPNNVPKDFLLWSTNITEAEESMTQSA